MTIFISSLIAIFTPTGLIVDERVENAIRDRVAKVEQLAVRIDNRPSYPVFLGIMDRVRIAARGLYPISDVRIEALEIETDQIKAQLPNSRLEESNILSRKPLKEPLQLGFRLVLKETDVNQAFESIKVQSYLEVLMAEVRRDPAQTRNYRLISAHLDVTEDQRLKMQINLEPRSSDDQKRQKLDILIEFGVAIIDGKTLQIIEPVASVNQRKVSKRFLNGLTNSLNRRLDLKRLESRGIIARILQLEIKEDKLNLAAFVRLEQLPTIYVK